MSQAESPRASQGAGRLGGAKRHWEIEVVDHEDLGLAIPPVSGDGRVVDVIQLEDAPGYVVPRSFNASCQDDPNLPVDVTLEIEVSHTDGVFVVGIYLAPRRHPHPDDGRWPLSRVPAQNWIGSIDLPVPQLLRDALAHAAMPAARAMIDEMGYHAEPALQMLRDKRKPRISRQDRDLFLRHYAEALANERLETETERLAAVWKDLHQNDPERWPSLSSVERLKREADAALASVGGWESFALQPGTYGLPEGWPQPPGEVGENRLRNVVESGDG